MWNPAKVVQQNAPSGAYEHLFCTYNDNLITHFARLSGDQMLAEDLVQQASVVMLEQGASSLRVLRNPGSYLFGVVRRLYLAELRRQSRQATLAMAEPPPELSPDVADVVCSAQQQRQLLQQIRGLRQRRDREILRRVLVLQEDKDTTCRALSLSNRHYDRVLHRAMVRLRGRLAV